MNEVIDLTKVKRLNVECLKGLSCCMIVVTMKQLKALNFIPMEEKEAFLTSAKEKYITIKVQAEEG